MKPHFVCYIPPIGVAAPAPTAAAALGTCDPTLVRHAALVSVGSGTVQLFLVMTWQVDAAPNELFRRRYGCFAA